MKNKLYAVFLVVVMLTIIIGLISLFKPKPENLHINDNNNIQVDHSSETSPSNKIWESIYYVDEFGDRTNEKYIINSKDIIGEFSNSATERSCLSVNILIDDSTRISLRLYEYCNNNPVKGKDRYIVYVKNADGSTYESAAIGGGDKVYFRDAEKVYNSLNTTGEVKFRIYETGRSGAGAKYAFSINTAPLGTLLYSNK